jgi:hypothetical protein
LMVIELSMSHLNNSKKARQKRTRLDSTGLS